MPTPVATARQCLTREAEQALDEAVAVARRRGHAQTTSIHLVSSLLSLPSSTLREACSRTRNNAYSTRIQFKALDICLGVSLDRLPSSNNKVDEPPVSNSLMAAIKRSQANQRRQPESAHFYQHQQKQLQLQQQALLSPSASSSSSVSVVKVELQNLILSVLDDPVVSRVFGESGFRSCEIKIAILRPVHQLFRYSRYRGPPMFLCNLSGDNELGRRGFSFSYTGFSGVLDGEENCRRIGEIMARGDGKRNPLLVGVCSNDALRSFSEMVQRRRERTILPVKLSGLGVVCIENEVLKFVSGNWEERLLKLRLEEIGKVVENCIGPGVVVNFGNLNAMASGTDDPSSVDAFRFVVCELAKLLKNHGRKVWLIGAAARYETYLKFLNMFPSVEQDLELQLLPITTSRFSMGESYPRSSLMESFVPFGGFFSTPFEATSVFGSLDHSASQQPCNEKCDRVNVLPAGECISSLTNHHQPSLSSWLNSNAFPAQNSLNIMKAKDDGTFSSTSPKANSSRVGSQITSVVGFQVLEDGKTNLTDDFRSPASTSSTPSDSKDVNSFMSRDSQHFSVTKGSKPTSLLSKGTPQICDLNLGIISTGESRELGRAATKDDRAGKYSTSSFHKINDQNFKTFSKALAERIGRQEEAVDVISQTIASCGRANERRHGVNRGDIWFSFVGPDRLAKKEIATALAEFHGSRENLIHVDLDFQDEIVHPEARFDRNAVYRGKNLVDNIADKLRKRPFSVLLLENVDRADFLVQSSLSKAVKIGKFSDSHGREFGIGNAIFIVTTSSGETNAHPSGAIDDYSEEDVLTVKGLPIQMIIGFDLGDHYETLDNQGKRSSNRIFMNKRKLIGHTDTSEQCNNSLEIVKRAHKASNSYLDLNFPAEEGEVCDADCSSRTWLEDFSGELDATVRFKPCDFDAIAQQILKDISECFQKIVRSECSLEIDSRVIIQMVAAAFVRDKKTVEEWIQSVLSNGFEKAREKYSLSGRSTVKLVAREEIAAEDQTPSELLPSGIILY